jgi:hypothetical protein
VSSVPVARCSRGVEIDSGGRFDVARVVRETPARLTSLIA